MKIYLKMDENDDDFFHLSYRGPYYSTYVCSFHTDNLSDLLGRETWKQFDELKPGEEIEVTFKLEPVD